MMSQDTAQTIGGPIGRILAMPNDSQTKTIVVALALCLVCSIIVAAAAVGLRPLQEANKALDKQRYILSVAGLDISGNIQATFDQSIETRLVDLASGDYVEEMDAAGYDQRKAAKDPQQNLTLSSDVDIASIKARAKIASIYLVKNGDTITRVILPVHGYGLWSTLYGFLAIEPDGNSVYGLKFYDHAETPGLGGEVDNPKWQAKWNGKQLLDANGKQALNVLKGNVSPDSKFFQHEIDGLAGATLTSRGVSNLVRFWTGANGFGPYLTKFKNGGA
ncbi:Na(+)-translocating NADH-quinone reductase subunit C [Solemya velum gill symbiont]|nr:Na(+)-translocating NADH-quinone reductase subunit C [Solemya velum gill symbiont]